MNKPSIPKGTRDFTPNVMQKREFIFDTIKSVFKLHGFQAIETPAMENLSTLLGKYGEEGDKLLFKILNSGDFLSKISEKNNSSLDDSKKLSSLICEKGLRYDLTVPFARFVAMNFNELTFPFKRYQIQTVWRADRPQKGRYREFFQCDVDIIGSKSLLNEFELVQIIDRVFQKLNINVEVLINNRKLLDGILASLGIEDKLQDVAIAIDKLDKIGVEKVEEELVARGLTIENAKSLLDIISNKLNTEDLLKMLDARISNTEKGKLGLEEMRELLAYINNCKLECEVKLDLTLARGLDYYTGSIFEVKAKDVQIGSICGGGRYDNLTEFFGMDDMSGVGVSFGADRIYDVLNEKNAFPSYINSSTSVMFVNFGKDEVAYIYPLLVNLRNNRISSELYPEADKMKKQMNYANKKQIPYVIIAGENEINQNQYMLKNMLSGEQQILDENSIIEILKNI